ncbi:MAG: histidine kinase [Acidobacteriota bacterium]|nr:histidine kinase [Acidobacteriota bacterium]
MVIATFAALTICLSVYRHLDFVANGEYRPAALTFLEEGVGGLAGLSVFPLIYLAAIRFPLPSPAWRRNLLAHFVSLCLISIVHTSLIVAYRAILFPLFGFGNVSYGYLPVRYPMEFAHLFIFYWLGLGLIYLFHEIRFARERELRQAKLEASLSEAQLQNLRLQLEPHFLFNALNAISAAIYEDPRIADEMVGRLSELLRQLLKSEPAQQVTLGREIELLQLYLRVMQARLEHRLHVEIHLEPDTKEALVPQLILQPLVENALRHGMDLATFSVALSIEARLEFDTLSILIRDGGPGLDPSTPLLEGIGLRNTRERLERLYGNRQSFTIRNSEGGGAIVGLRLPFSVAAVPARPAAMARV